MKFLRRKKLPPAPTGTEVLDLVWASLVPLAPYLLNEGPTDADPAWAMVEALRSFWLLLQASDQAKRELDRTPETSTVRRLRERHHAQLTARCGECAKLIFMALAARARSANRKASLGQLWVLVFEDFKTLVNANRAELAKWELP